MDDGVYSFDSSSCSAIFYVLFVINISWYYVISLFSSYFNFMLTCSIDFIRSAPPLVQLYFMFYSLPKLAGITLDPYSVAILTLGVHFSTYIGEVFRAGIEAVDEGQWEAATALNMSTYQKWIKIILPQAIPPTIPMLGNYLILMFKEDRKSVE